MEKIIIVAIVVLSVCIVAFLKKAFKLKKMISGAILNSLIGLTALLVVNFFSLITTVFIPYSYFSVAFSSLFGALGVVGLFLINLAV